MTRRSLIIVILLAFGLACSAFAVPTDISHSVVIKAKATGTDVKLPGRYLDETIYYEDWETGDLDEWNPIDLTSQPSTWHIDDWNAFGGSGTSWWVGDTSIVGSGPLNGYLDDWYMALDSPPITLPATSPALRFWHRYRCEEPAGTFPAGYNGWDGLNLRISTDGGATWTVVPGAVLTPTYDRTSLYSFGFQHGEGLNIPGWCGLTNGNNWHMETANLTQWAGQSVKFRFAFASDPEYSTADDRSMFGWQIDNIRVFATADTVFSDDCNAVGEWTDMSVRPVGGNLWRIATDASSPAGQHIVVCNNASNNLYGPNMNNVLESPIIDISDLAFGTLIADVQVTGAVMCDQASFPDCDYWGMEVSSDGGGTWCAVSNPTCEPPPAQNFVYIDCPATWSSFNESYSDLMDFSALIGTDQLKFRFTFQSNDDASLAVGPKFDGFSLEYTSGFPNDVSCYTLQVRYPNMANRPFKVKAYFRNAGSNAQNNIQTWWRVVGSTWRPFIGTFSMDPGQIVTRDTLAVVNTAGEGYMMQARSALGSDDNVANDTSTVANISVKPASQNVEIGYDNRTTQFRFNYATGNGPMVKFTPYSDGTLTDEFSVLSILCMYDMGQPGDLPIQYHIYTDDNGSPGTEIYDQQITVLSSETGTWKSVDVSGVAELQNTESDFWLWLEVLSSGTDRYPQILGDDKLPWDDVHFYTWTGSGGPTPSDFFYQMHALISAPSGVDDEAVSGVPAQWSLEQNYPNPFNPSTEIRYSVPKAEQMTLKVYNVMGQEVATLVDAMVQPGNYHVSFSGASLASGVYVYRLESASFTATHKMLLMK